MQIKQLKGLSLKLKKVFFSFLTRPLCFLLFDLRLVVLFSCDPAASNQEATKQTATSPTLVSTSNLKQNKSIQVNIFSNWETSHTGHKTTWFLSRKKYSRHSSVPLSRPQIPH